MAAVIFLQASMVNQHQEMWTSGFAENLNHTTFKIKALPQKMGEKTKRLSSQVMSSENPPQNILRVTVLDIRFFLWKGVSHSPR